MYKTLQRGGEEGGRREREKARKLRRAGSEEGRARAKEEKRKAEERRGGEADA